MFINIKLLITFRIQQLCDLDQVGLDLLDYICNAQFLSVVERNWVALIKIFFFHHEIYLVFRRGCPWANRMI